MQLILEWRIWLTVNNWIISVTGQLSRRCFLYVYEARDFWHKNLELNSVKIAIVSPANDFSRIWPKNWRHHNSCVVFFSPNTCVADWQFLPRYLELGTGKPYHGTKSLVDFSRLEKITQTIKHDHFPLTFGQTSGENFISGNFYWIKSCVVKFQGESKG